MENLSLEFCTFCFFSYSFSTFSSCPLYSRTDLEHHFLLCLAAELKGVGGRSESGRVAAGVQISVGMITDSVWPVLYNTCGELLALPSQRVQGLQRGPKCVSAGDTQPQGKARGGQRHLTCSLGVTGPALQ